MPHTAAPAVARALEASVGAQIARSLDPDGKPWAETLDGRKALANAAAAVTVTPVGDAVVLVVEGPEALHDQGKARGHVQRKIIPKGALPSRMATTIGDALDLEFGRIMAAGGRR